MSSEHFAITGVTGTHTSSDGKTLEVIFPGQVTVQSVYSEELPSWLGGDILYYMPEKLTHVELTALPDTATGTVVIIRTPSAAPSPASSHQTSLKFELGEPVLFTDTVAKKRVNSVVEWHSAGVPSRAVDRMNEKKAWVREYRTLNTGVIVGSRTLSEYSVEHYYDEGSVISCIPATAKRAWLVSYDMRRKPVLVLDEHIKSLRPSEEELF